MGDKKKRKEVNTSQTCVISFAIMYMFDNIKGLLTSKDQSVRNKIEEIAQKLGGITKEEIYG